MKPVIATALTATALLFAVAPAHGLGRMGGASGGGTPLVVAPQQTVLLPSGQAVIVPRPFLFAQRGFVISSGVAVPSGFVAFRTFHQRFGHVIVFVNPSTFAVWPSGFWSWSGAGWTWVTQPIGW
jgi:hypothetical protein